MGKFRSFLKNGGLYEDESGTSSADIASVDSKLDFRKNKHLEKGKKCKKHGKRNCQECQDLYEDSKWK